MIIDINLNKVHFIHKIDNNIYSYYQTKIMTAINVPITPKHMIGHEPSLSDLEKFICPENINEEYCRGVKQYIIDAQAYTQSSQHEGKYYLYGQKQIEKSTPITQLLIEEAIEINKSRFEKYGGPCNSFEAMSIQKHENDFISVLSVIEKYYSMYNIPNPP